MLAYQFTLPAAEIDVKPEPLPEGRRRSNAFTEALERMNKELGKGRADEEFCLFAFRQNAEGVLMIAMSRELVLCPEDVESVLCDYFRKEKIRAWKYRAADFHEITLASFFSAFSSGEDRDIIDVNYRTYKELGLGDAKDYFAPGNSRDECRIAETVSAQR